jgi:cyclohexa-1,5-dienecarbonyl-CoA hydratase
MALDAEPVRVDLLEDGALLRVLLDRPKGNVLTTGMAEAVRAALLAHQGAPRLKMVCLRGAGGHFSYGASIEEHREPAMAALLGSSHDLARAVASYPVPVAALVEGRCLGGAFELVLCCHLVFATKDARFAWPEIKLGVFPPLAAAVAPLRLGALADRLILTGEEVDAQVLRGAGFVAAVLDDGDPERALVEWHRARLGPLSVFAIRQATQALRWGSKLLEALERPLARTEAQYLERVLPSHDGREGIGAFLEHREPRWEGR